MTTGERIKELRLQKGLSQEELGAMIGVKKAAINKYETGVVVNLKRSTIASLASALDTSPMYLMGWEESEKNKPAEPELDELDKELLRLAAQLTTEQKRRQVETLRDIVGKKDT